MATDSKANQTAHTKRTESAIGARVDTFRLVQTSGEQKGRAWELVRPEAIVGASDKCDICVVDDTVSRQHFGISRTANGYVLRDLGSTNGTMLNGTRVREAVLSGGSAIQAGDVLFRCEPLLEQADIEPSEATSFGAIQGQSVVMRAMFAVLERVAASDITVLLTGETGTGKSALARAIHEASLRASEPFLIVDCGAITPTLVESELFGHERGAFTGAVKERRGAFEAAGKGTLFIDELTELAPHLQPKLLRALEDRSITRVGSHTSVSVHCRVIAATQRDLWAEVEAETFRADLYFRLAVITVPLPPLRERRDDLPLLVDHFLAETPLAERQCFDDLNPELQRRLLSHDWPGNIRELRNTIQRISLMYSDNPFPGRRGTTSSGGQVQPAGSFAADLDLPFKEAKDQLLAAFERAYVARLLERAGGNVTQAARDAGLDRKHIYNLLAKHGLSPDKS